MAHDLTVKGMRSARGSVLALILIISVVITGLVVTIAWTVGTSTQMTSGYVKVDQSFYAAQAGLEKVAWYCKNGKMSSITSPVTGTLNGYTYTTSWATVSGNTIRITSKGSLGNVSSTVSETVTPANTTPVIAAAGDFDNKNITVNGNLAVGGNYTDGGNGNVVGNLAYGGTASNATGNVSGTITPASFTPINFASLQATLIGAAGATYSGNQASKTFDFTAIPGSNKVIYVNGNVTNPTFVGSGTLYVSGTVSAGAYGTSALPVNIVSGGDMTSSNNITVYGSLYVGGNWNEGKYQWNGYIYVTGTVARENSSQSTITQTTLPWFDPRGSSGGSSTSTTFTNFAGPSP